MKEMYVSKCCRDMLWVEHGDSNAMYYSCMKCFRPCDRVENEDVKDDSHE
jgi:hypothetical protein